MICPNCSSIALEELSSEMMLHYVGVEKLKNSGILISPKILVCLDCGFSYFTTPENELALLREVLFEKAVSSEESIRTTAA
jgi:hypothetical protein